MKKTTSLPLALQVRLRDASCCPEGCDVSTGEHHANALFMISFNPDLSPYPRPQLDSCCAPVSFQNRQVDLGPHFQGLLFCDSEPSELENQDADTWARPAAANQPPSLWQTEMAGCFPGSSRHLSKGQGLAVPGGFSPEFQPSVWSSE